MAGVAVPGSRRAPLPGAEPVGAADPDEPVAVSVMLRRKQHPRNWQGAPGHTPPSRREYPGHDEYQARYGADPADIEKVADFASAHRLEVAQTSASRRTVSLVGRAGDVGKAFGVALQRYRYPGGQYRGRKGSVHVPARLAPVVKGVFGLDDRPATAPPPAPAPVERVSFNPADLARRYRFPQNFDGSGQYVGIVSLAGGFRQQDLDSFFQAAGVPAPKVTAVSVDGAVNDTHYRDHRAACETLLDVCVLGAAAPGVHIVVYFAPKTGRGFIDALTTAVHDGVRKPSVLSLSLGSAEALWTAQYIKNIDGIFREAAELGMTVCCASGDDGSRDGVGDGRAHVSFPASSPYALACGGTVIDGDGAPKLREQAWNDRPAGGATGGGVSEVFGLPDWQRRAKVVRSVNRGAKRGRGLPDVAACAAAYTIVMNGKPVSQVGTSASTPLWAALLARINQALGRRVGFVNPLLYGAAARGLRGVTRGNNDAYRAGKGWNACTGLGTPDGERLLQALSK